MFVSNAFAQTAGAAPAPDAWQVILAQLPMFVGVIGILYFLVLRPQQARVKAHQAMVAGVKRGDWVVTTGGLVGKVRQAADDELRVELATNVEVRVVRSAIAEVRTKGEPAPANDSKKVD